MNRRKHVFYRVLAIDSQDPHGCAESARPCWNAPDPFGVGLGPQLGGPRGVAKWSLGGCFGSEAFLGPGWPQEALRQLPRPILERLWLIFNLFMVDVE